MPSRESIKTVKKPEVKKPVKTFTVTPWDSSNEGEKILLYSETGMGKTTLSAMAPRPVFIGLDEGGRKIRHPITNELLNVIPDIETFEDVRAALQQPDLFKDGETAVIDTVTILEDFAYPYLFRNIPKENGTKVTNIVMYGYNKGYQHLYDAMKLILVDCDRLIHQGKNVILVAQSVSNRVSNPGGDDYLRDGPRLYAGKPSVEALYCEWADHILRIGFQDMLVEDKKIRGTTTRVIFAKQELHFRAKSRTIEEPIIAFADKTDDSIWKFIFGEQ